MGPVLEPVPHKKPARPPIPGHPCPEAACPFRTNPANQTTLVIRITPAIQAHSGLLGAKLGPAVLSLRPHLLPSRCLPETRSQPAQIPVALASILPRSKLRPKPKSSPKTHPESGQNPPDFRLKTPQSPSPRPPAGIPGRPSAAPRMPPPGSAAQAMAQPLSRSRALTGTGLQRSVRMVSANGQSCKRSHPPTQPVAQAPSSPGKPPKPTEMAATGAAHEARAVGTQD